MLQNRKILQIRQDSLDRKTERFYNEADRTKKGYAGEADRHEERWMKKRKPIKRLMMFGLSLFLVTMETMQFAWIWYQHYAKRIECHI